MKIGYATLNAIPSLSAASLNTYQMCNALASYATVYSYFPLKFWRLSTMRSCDSFYGAVRFIERRMLDIPRCPNIYLSRLSAKVDNDGIDLMYCRKIVIAERMLGMGLDCILELHSMYDLHNSLRSNLSVLESNNFKKFVVLNTALAHDANSYLRAQGIDISDKFHVAHDAVDLNMFNVGDISTIKGNPRSVGYFGLVSESKGVGFILNVARKLPGYDFHFYGRVDNKFSQAYRHSLPCNVFLHGYRPHHLIPSLMQNMGALLLPNPPNMILGKSDDIAKYTSPMKAFEYMATGRPIISSTVAAVKEIFESDCCYYAEYGDVDAWSSRIQEAFDNESKSRMLSKNSLDKVQRHTFDSRVRSILGFLK